PTHRKSWLILFERASTAESGALEGFYVRSDSHRWQAVSRGARRRVEDREGGQRRADGRVQRRAGSLRRRGSLGAAFKGEGDGRDPGRRARRQDPGIPPQAQEAVQEAA